MWSRSIRRPEPAQRRFRPWAVQVVAAAPVLRVPEPPGRVRAAELEPELPGRVPAPERPGRVPEPVEPVPAGAPTRPAPSPRLRPPDR
jgi:hypothetical protein